MTGRQRAYRQPIPVGWKPAEGERVYLPCQTMAYGVVKVVNGGYAVVKCKYGTKKWTKIFEIQDLRPLRS